MSRLDWFTIVLVGICIAALGFLVYKTIQLINNDEDASPTTEVAKTDMDNEELASFQNSGENQTDDGIRAGAGDQDLDDDELPYDPKEVEAPEDRQPEPETSSPPKSAPGSQTAAAPAPATSSSTSSSSSTGDYMVVAGSFSQRYNAESQVKNLKSLGYNNARVEIFNSGSLATALVDRYDNYNSAKRLVNELKGKGVDAFVKRKK